MKKLLLTLLVLGAVKTVDAQRYFGVATSNWGGNNTLYLNPANIADSRSKFTIDLASINFGIDNSLGTINSTSVLNKIYKGDSLSINDLFKYGNNHTFSMLAPYGELRGPGFSYSINHRHSIAVTSRIRFFNQFNNFDQNFYRTLTDPNFNTSGDYNLTSKNFNWTAQMWSEIGLTYGVVLLESGKSQLKAGLTVRYLGGIAYIGLKGNNMDAHYYGAKDSLVATHTDIEFASNVVSSTDELANGLTASDLAGRFFNSNGWGIGGDIGLVYEYRPDYPDRYIYEMDGRDHIDRGRNMYKLRVSAAVTDIGAINYKNDNLTARFTGNGYMSSGDFAQNFNNFNDFRNYAQSHGFTVDSSRANSTKVYLPTALVMGLDYHIRKGFYLNATYIANVANRSNYGNTYYDQLTITPRLDRRLYSIALPVTYGVLSSSLKMGLGVRVAGFFLGSDDVLAAFNNTQYGFNFYFGGYIPINKKKIRDRDHDGISDRYDWCPRTPGALTAHGCPDRDGDSVADRKDYCPDEPGPVELDGCPDRDHDGVADIDDDCPDTPGLEDLNGCPDTDGDGIADKDDACPTKPGLAQYHGCPDSDGDGIPDNEDACPNERGLPQFQGCPDKDGDGVPDKDDKCPDVAGPKSNNGCPVAVKEEAKKRLQFAAKALEFETGKAVIKQKSYSGLNDIARLLKEYPDYEITIDGYTDNVGKPEKNLELSRERAEAVENYFVNQGIDENRIEARGHGEANPVVSNKTAAGRARNRRVVMDLKLKK